MNIEYIGLGKVIVQGKKRFVQLPAALQGDTDNIPLTAVRLPSMALYTRPADAVAYLKKYAPPPKRPTREQKNHFLMMLDSLLETRLVRGKPLEIPYYLSADSAGRIGCLKITQGPAILALYIPGDIIKALKMLILDFGNIIFHDKRDIEMKLSIKRITP